MCKGNNKESPVPSSGVQPSRRKAAIQVSPRHALPSTSWQAIQVSPTPVGNFSQVLLSTSRQVIQVQQTPAGKISQVPVESRRGGEIQEALQSGSSLKLGQGQNARTFQIFPSTRNQMPGVETDLTDDNKSQRLKEENYFASKMSQTLPGTSSQVAQDEASPSRQELQVATDSMSNKLQVLPSPDGSVLQDDPCPKGLLVQEFQHPGGKLVEIGSKSYFVVGAHPERGGQRSQKFPEESKKADSSQI